MVKHLLKIIVVLFSLFGQNASAQFRLPVVFTTHHPGSVTLQDLHVQVDVVGNVATTTFDMTFSNSSSRRLEGEFEFPLGDGQTVSRYALDIDGKLREGVVVEKEKGRKVFEEIERQNIDPGLIEKTKGNNFKTRIYPFNPFGKRRVVVGYEQELKTTDGKRYYRLPLVSDSTLSNFSIDINLHGQALPIVEKGSMNLKFNKYGNNYKAAYNKKDYKLDKNIVIELPERELPSLYAENAGATTYFYTYMHMKPKQQEKILPKSLTVIYDVSASAQSANQLAIRDLLKNYIKKCGLSQVRLVTFSYKIHSDVTCSPEKALKKLERCVYDGATQLGCIDFTKYTSDEVILVTDGLGNIGNEDPVKGNKVVHVVNGSNVSDHAYLRKIAATNNGNYVDLKSVDANEAYRLLTTDVYSYLGAKYDGNQIKDVYPSISCPVGESFSVAGVLMPKTAKITLYFGFGNKITDSVTCEVSALYNNQEAKNVKRIWAQKKIAELEMDQKRNAEEITETAKKFGVVTANTSLIVLDRVEDYVRYGIVPPIELRDAYNELVRKQPTLDNATYELSKLIIKARKEFLDWWNTKFDPNAKPKPNKAKAENLSSFFDVADNNAEVVSMDAEAAPVTMEDAEAESTTVSSYGREQNDRIQVSDEANNQSEPTSSISIQYWNPDVPYLSTLKSTPANEMYDVYLKLRNDYKSSPAFYIDVADYFYRENQVENAIRIVSNLCELKLEDAEIARSCGKKLEEYKNYALAVSVFENIVKIRSEEPQAYRDLALACWGNGEYQRAADLLYKVSSNLWNTRFKNVQQITINELNALIAEQPGKIDTTGYDQRLMGNCPVDIRILLSWNTNDSDIDLWVTDPNNEKCYYSNKQTVIGGRISDDITRGYGPEEFCLKVAKEGKYKIEANYYGTSSQKLLQPVVVTATVFTHFGTNKQKKQVLNLQLLNGKDTYKVGEIEFKK